MRLKDGRLIGRSPTLRPSFDGEGTRSEGNYPSDHVGADTWETDEEEAIVSLTSWWWWWLYLHAETEGAGHIEWMQIRISEASITHHQCSPTALFVHEGEEEGGGEKAGDEEE